MAMRRVVRQSDPQSLDTTTNILPEEDTGGERQHFLFYQDEGGLRATDEANDSLDTIYYLGIIDILTPYNTFKKLEHCWKGLQADRVSVLVVCGDVWPDEMCSIKSVPSRRRSTPTGSSHS